MDAWPGLPGSQTTPARAAASAVRWMRSELAQYHDTSMTMERSAKKARIAPAKITMT